MIPEALLLDENVTKNDLLVYVGLLQFKNNKNGKAFPSIATIAKLARSSENTVRTALSHLAELGYITISSRYDHATKSNKSNVYTLLNVDEKEITSLLASEVVETPKEVVAEEKPKKRIIRRKKGNTTPTAPTKKEQTASAQKSPLVKKVKPLETILEELQEEMNEVTETALEQLGVDSADELDAKGMDYLNSVLNRYVEGEGLLQFGMFYERELGTKIKMEDLKEIFRLTKGEYEKAIEGVNTMKQLIKDNHKIHNKYAYLKTIISRCNSKKVAK